MLLGFYDRPGMLVLRRRQLLEGGDVVLVEVVIVALRVLEIAAVLLLLLLAMLLEICGRRGRQNLRRNRMAVEGEELVWRRLVLYLLATARSALDP